MFGNTFGEFMDAVKSGNAATVGRLYLDEWINKEDDIGWQPIHWACHFGYADVVKILFDKECQIESEDKWDGRRPIHMACDVGNVDVVRLLVGKGCQMEVADENGWRPIHCACRNGHADVVCLLLDIGCEVEAADAYGWRPIHLACDNGHSAVVQILIERGCEIETVDKKDGRRPIHYACAKGHIVVAKLLLDRGCEIEASDKKGKTPLDLVKESKTQSKASECIRMIETVEKSPAVFVAAREDDLKTFQKRLCPLWTKERRTRQTLLDVIIQVNSKSIIKFIKLKPIIDKDITDFLSLDRHEFSEQSYRLLRQWFVHCCIQHNIDWAFLRLCCADVVNSSPLPSNGMTCLDTAVEHRRSLCVQHILHKYVGLDHSWDRARSVAVQKGYDEIVELMQYRKTKLQRNASVGRNRLHLAVTEGDVDMVEYLLRNGLANHSEANQDGDTPLMMAIANRMDECAHTMKQYGADFNFVNKHGQTVLHIAVTSGMHKLPEWFISGHHQFEQFDCMGLTALHQAVVVDLEDIATELVALGADHRSMIQADAKVINTKKCRMALTTKENASSLCLKLHGRLYSSFLDLFQSNDFFDGNGDSLLHLTVRLTNVDDCKRMLEKRTNVHIKNKMDRTPLMELLYRIEQKDVALSDDAIAIVRCLVEHDADIEDEDSSGRTALQMAICLPGADIERLLLEMVKTSSTVRKLFPDDFSSCIQRKLCKFLEVLLPLLGKALTEELITINCVRLSMATLPSSMMREIFRCAGSAVQNVVIDDMLLRAASENDDEYFENLLQHHSAEWIVMNDGETILTALLKATNVKFFRKLSTMHNASKLVQLTNWHGESPLMIAIKMGVDEIIDELILETKVQESENNEVLSALSLLFEQVSTTQGERHIKLTKWIKLLILKSANIYSVNRHGQSAISFCTNSALRSGFEEFFHKQHRYDVRQKIDAVSEVQERPVSLNVCTVCMDRPINCCLPCGHTFCIDCVEVLSKCPYCRSTDMTTTRIFLNG